MKRQSFLRVMAGCSMLVMLAAMVVPRTGISQGVNDPFGNPFLLGPAVRIASPASHTTFYAPVDIPIFAFTRAEANITNLEFYTNGVPLGAATSLATTNRPLPYFNYVVAGAPLFTARFRSLWCLTWSNAPAGAYTLTAVAQGIVPNEPGISSINRTSAPVNITILSSTNGTNPTDIVSILATDPMAIAGTNISWVWPGQTNAVPSWTNWPPPHWGYFTNWGPKPALFTVRRFGDASSALTVNYKISGNASNGLDYLALPGSITIPAGGGYGLIPIVPVDNGSNNFEKTVVLTLSPATNTPPNYLLGFPRQAEALILYRWLRPPLFFPDALPAGGGFLTDGAFHLNASGPDGAWYSVQNSTDLANWTSLCTNQVVDGSVDFIDPGASGVSSGFYRVVTNSPPQ